MGEDWVVCVCQRERMRSYSTTVESVTLWHARQKSLFSFKGRISS